VLLDEVIAGGRIPMIIGKRLTAKVRTRVRVRVRVSFIVRFVSGIWVMVMVKVMCCWMRSELGVVFL
jgi:hypothetical protein